MKNIMLDNFDSLFNRLNINETKNLDLKNIFSRVITFQEIKKGGILLNEGFICDKMYFLNRGLLKSCYLNAGGEETTSSFIEEHNFFTNLQGFSRNEKSTESIIALEDSVISFMKKKDYLDILNQFPHVSEINHHIINEHRIRLENRNRILQCLTAKEKYERFKLDFPLLHKKLKRSYIASYLGIRLETLSRIK